jgi:hypothetical protein
MDPNEALRRLRNLVKGQNGEFASLFQDLDVHCQNNKIEWGNSVNVRRLRRIGQSILNGDVGKVVGSYEMAEVFEGLDEWIMKGGFMPKDWLS